MYQTLTHCAYFALVVLLATLVPQGYLGSLEEASGTIFVVGALGLWRYPWATLNFLRAVYFRRVAYPARKRRLMRAYADEGRSLAYFMVTSHMVEPEVSVPVERSVFTAAANNPHGATIVASVVDG